MSSGSGLGWFRTVARRSGTQAAELSGLELTEHSAGRGGQPSQPVIIQQAVDSSHGTHHIRCASSGSGLPSALSTPPQPCRVPADDGQQEQQQEQQGAGSSAASGSSRLQKSVRWQSQPQAADSALQPQGDNSGEAALATGSLQGLRGNKPSPDDGTAAQQAQRQAPAHAARQQPLPPSDDQQLDNYLRYLLQEQHPHRFLYYPGWGLTDSGCAAIGAFLARDKRIKVATLSGNGIADEGMELIAEGLACNSSLLSLDLAGNQISSVGAVDLAEALHSDKCKLTELLLSNNRIGDDGADALAGAVASSCTLKKVKLSGNPVSAAQLEVVQHALKTREYKLSSQPQPGKQGKHMHKASSGLQFDIELMESQSRSGSSSNLVGRAELMRLPPSAAVAALVEAQDPLESSIAMQAAHLLAELHKQDQQRAASQQAASTQQPSTSPADTAAASQPSPSLAVQLAIRLAARGYDVVLRTCFPTLHGGVADDDANTSSSQEQQHKQQQQQRQGTAHNLLASGLRHTFVRVSQPLHAHEAVVLPAVIVDPLFKDQWVMPHATQRLQDALDALPQVLCLAEARLWHLVELLCTETAASFKATGLSLPPWRHTPAVMDKWLSSKHVDMVVEHESCAEELENSVQSVTVS